MNMDSSNRDLRSVFIRAMDLATATSGDLAKGAGRTLRTAMYYRSGERRVTPDAARKLADYLRRRSVAFTEIADELERAADEEEGDGQER